MFCHGPYLSYTMTTTKSFPTSGGRLHRSIDTIKFCHVLSLKMDHLLISSGQGGPKDGQIFLILPQIKKNHVLGLFYPSYFSSPVFVD